VGGALTKVLHFADLHLGIEAHGRPDPATGINQRVLDVAARLDEIVEHALAREVDLVLFAGDAFKNATPHPTLQKMLAERVRRLTKAGVRVFLLAGNHDLPRMAANVTAFSVYSALEAENVWIAERAGVYRIPLRDGKAIQVAAIPHFWPRAIAEQLREDGKEFDPDLISHQVVARTVRDLAAEIDPSLPAVLTAHLEIKGAKRTDSQDRYDTTEVRVQPAALANAAFSYVALGHIHDVAQTFDRSGSFIRYAGSLERVDFGEEKDEKGFYVVTFDGATIAVEPEFVPVHPRRFLTIDTGSGEDVTASVLDAVGAHDVAQTIVRVRVRAPRERFASLDRRRVHEALAEAYESTLLCIPPDDAPSAGRDPRFAEQMSEKAALAEFVASVHPNEAEPLIALGNDLIDEVLAET
jgi:DNA repair protein SbcD/Mre11